MGAVVARLIFKNARENVSSSAESAWEIGAKNIDGELIEPLGQIVKGKKCVMIMNVATKWGLTKQNYTEAVQLHE